MALEVVDLLPWQWDLRTDEITYSSYKPIEPGKEEVSEIMKYAYEQNIPVVCRGAGTGLAGGATCKYGGIMLSVMRMNKIFPVDHKNQTITAQPGALLIDIQAAAKEEGLFYPPDPGEKSATIGGNISTNAGGMRAVKYGVTRDYVRGLEVVLPNGKIVEFGGKVVKNSSGYSLKDLMIGSEGTLGFITKATLKLLPLPKKAISLLIPFKTLKKQLTQYLSLSSPKQSQLPLSLCRGRSSLMQKST